MRMIDESDVGRWAGLWMALVVVITGVGTSAFGEDATSRSGVDLMERLKAGTVVAFGDSTTAPRGPLVVYASRLQTLFAEEGVESTVINAGVPSNSTDDGRERFHADVLAHQPGLVIIQFGINDSAIDVWRDPPATEARVGRARYQENLKLFLKELHDRGIAAVLMTPNPMRWAEKTRELYDKAPYDVADPDGFNVLLRDYAEAVREVAKECRAPLVDVYAAFQAYDAEEGQSMDDLLLDGMHPNDAGHALVGALIWRALSGAETE